MSNQIYSNATQRYADQNEDFTITMVRGAGGDDWTLPLKLRLDGRRILCTILQGTNPALAGAAGITFASKVVAGNVLPVKYRPTGTNSSAVCAMGHVLAGTQNSSACSLVVYTDGTIGLFVLGGAVTGIYSPGSSCSYYLE